MFAVSRIRRPGGSGAHQYQSTVRVFTVKIFVIGAGTMGSGIAQVAAQAGNDVYLRDIDMKFVEKGLAGITKALAKQVEKGKLQAADKDATLKRIKGFVNLADGKDADVVIEAAVENLEIKKKIFAELDGIVQPNAILASNTSSLSITAVAAATKRPDKVIGMHFFNPVPVMKLVEVIRGQATSDATHQTVIDLAKKLGKEPVTVNEAPGFVVNRLLIPMINEAAYTLTEGVATAEDIDSGMKLGANHPMGPLALGDLIGLDVCLANMEVLHAEFGDSKYRPAPLMRKLVRAGHLGRKSGQGFFKY
jgi:3-hydroxybutyryl-CoA dehydrogenase